MPYETKSAALPCSCVWLSKDIGYDIQLNQTYFSTARVDEIGYIVIWMYAEYENDSKNFT